MTRLRILICLGIGAVLGLVSLWALLGSASADPDPVPPTGLFQISGTLPSWLLAPEIQTNCLMRWEGNWEAPGEGTVVFREVCYRGTTIDPNATPGPPPYLGDFPEITFEHEVLTGIYTEKTDPAPDELYILVLPCMEVLPGSLYVEFSMNFLIDGGSESGTATVRTSSSSSCSTGTDTVGSLTLTKLDLDNDTDLDGCTDWYELGENPELGGLNDPFNPGDCTTVLSADGLYEISHEYAGSPVGGYRRCMGAVETSPQLQMRVYCYTDSTAAQINPEGYPGEVGDGLPGAPPPGPDIGGGALVYGDVDIWHSVLSGQLNGSTVSFSGCLEDVDGLDPLGNIYVQWDWDVQTGAGVGLDPSKMWIWQTVGNCTGDTPSGSPAAGTLQALKLATTAQLNGPFGDNDPPTNDRNDDGVIDAADKGDGVPDHLELRDDTLCGLRDPFNINDYYDVSIPRDGIIDQFNDIVGVINNYEPVGYTAGDPAYVGPGTLDNYDRRSPMTGGAGAWNRGSPDLKIDMFNDIVGVIGQYNPVGC